MTNDTKTILLVEDEALIALSEKTDLERFGYAVTIANTGEQAVELVRTTPEIDLILMDLDLGSGIAGDTAAEKILAIRHLPIVFLTSHSEREYVDRVKGISRYGYVIKNSGAFVLWDAIEVAFELYEANQRYEQRTAELEEAHRQLDRFFSVTPDLQCIVDVNGTLVKVNSAWERTLGYSVEEVEGQPVFDFLHPDDVQPAVDIIAELHRQQHEISIVNRYRCRDGTFRCMEWRAQSSGNLIYDAARDVTERLRVEDERRQLLEEYEAVLQTTQDAMFLVEVTDDNEFRFVRNNHAHQEATGLPLSEFRGKTPYELLGPGLGEQVSQNYRRCVEAATSISYEEELDLPGGKRAWSTTLTPILRDGVVVFIVGSGQDVTKVRDQENRLRTKRWRLESILEGTHVGTWEWNVQTGETVFNERWAEMLGYSLDELAPMSVKTWEALTHPDDLEAAKDILNRHFSGELPRYDLPIRMRHKDGHWIWVHDRGKVTSWTDDGLPLMMFGTHTDVTEDKREEELLREREERFASLFEHAPLGYQSLDTDGNLLMVNRAWLDTFGYTRDEVVGRWFGDFLAPEYTTDLEQRFLQLQESGTVHAEFEMIHKNGDRRYVAIEGTIGRDGHGQSHRTHCILQDITERREAEQRIQQLLREKEMILRESHHRIKNNMSTIASMLSLQASTTNSRETAEALLDARSRLHSMTVLYDRLYRSESVVEISVADYLSPLVDEIASVFANRGRIGIETEFEDFVLDARQLSHIGIVVNELVTNAMKHAFHDGQRGTISVSARREDGHAVVVVADDGKGIPEHIKCSSNPGFGLQFVNMLAEQLNGAVHIERDNGTRFRIEFAL